MKNSIILAFILSLGFIAVPYAALAQAGDQTTAVPMATATVNPMATATDQSMAGATAAPETSTYTTTTGGGGNGIWGLVGLIGLLGLFGGRSRRTTTTISGPP